jgi:hypothetical protein
MTREEVRVVLEAEGVDLSTWEEDDETFFFRDGTDMELVFDEDNRLFQIAVELADRFQWAGRRVLDVPLHEALLAMQAVVGGAGWRLEDAVSDPLGETAPPSDAAVPSDAKLLYEGTLWLPGPGLALMLCEGAVCEIAWREPRHVPKPLLRGVSPEQLEWSQSPDRGEALRAQMLQEHKAAVPAAQKWVNWAAMVLIAASLVIAWGAIQDYRAAPILKGTFESVTHIEGGGREIFLTNYVDPQGNPQMARLEQADFYVPPREPGAEVEIRYLGGDPPAVFGVARGGSPVFEALLPTLGIMVSLYLGLVILTKILGRPRPVKTRR